MKIVWRLAVFSKILAVLIACLLLASAYVGKPAMAESAAGLFDFSSGTGSEFSFYNPTGLFTLDSTQGSLRLIKPDDNITGTDVKGAEIMSNFTFGGDFDVSIDYKLNTSLADGQQLEFWLYGSIELGLVRSNEVWLKGDNYHVFFNGNVRPIQAIQTNDSRGTLRITRTDQTVTAYAKSPNASEYILIDSEVFNSGDVVISMHLQNQPNRFAALDASFDNLSVKADHWSLSPVSTNTITPTPIATPTATSTLLPLPYDQAPEHVIFPDPKLEAAVRDTIGKPTGNIYQTDLVGLTGLGASSRGIANLRGLEYCTRLTSLDLGENQIIDISSLSSLTNLTWLGLGWNQISDISPLSSLTSLSSLQLCVNQISDVSALAGLTSLTWLDLNLNQISDISALASLTKLTELHLGVNQIRDISSLSTLTNLTWLNIDGNQISVLSPLAALTNLITLQLNTNQISDISPLSSLSNLTNLWLNSNKVSDIQPLVSNLGLAQGDTVGIPGNPLSVDSVTVYIPQLQGRGVKVLYDNPAPAEESALTDGVHTRDQISTNPAVVSTNFGLAIATVLVFYLAATIFNSTIRENYGVIQGWPSRGSARLRFLSMSTTKGISSLRSFFGNKSMLYIEWMLVILLCALIYLFLEPYFVNFLRHFALFLSLAIGILIATSTYEGTQVLASVRTFRVPAAIRLYPIAILIAAIFVAISRNIHFHPGLIYGFVGAYAALSISKSKRLNTKQRAITIMLGILAVLAVTLAAFFLRELIKHHWGGESFAKMLVEDILVAAIAIGLEGLLFSIALPVTFMDGKRIKDWSLWVWAACAIPVVLAFYYIIINPDHSLAQAVKDMNVHMMFGLMGIALIISGLIYLYFWLRKRRLQTHAVEKQPSEGIEEGEEHGTMMPTGDGSRQITPLSEEDGNQSH